MKSILPLFIAIVMGVVAVVGVRRYIEDQREAATRGMELVDVLAAAKRLEVGSTITRAMVRPKKVEVRFLPDEAVEPAAVRRLVGQVLRRNVDRGTILQWDFFESAKPKDDRGILPGERAVTIPVDTIRGVAGLIQPNSRIDIYGTFSLETKEKKGATERRTVLLLSDVTVLATDHVTGAVQARSMGRERRKQGYSSLTLAATPDEAALLIFAQSSGDLHVVLRGREDVAPLTEPIEIDLKSLIERARKANQERARKLPAATGIEEEPKEP